MIDDEARNSLALASGWVAIVLVGILFVSAVISHGCETGENHRHHDLLLKTLIDNEKARRSSTLCPVCREREQKAEKEAEAR